MPRYFFHVHDLLGAIKDDEGMDLADLDEAKAEAVRSAREMVAEGKKVGAAGLDRVIEVKTAEGETVFMLIFEEAFLRDLGS